MENELISFSTAKLAKEKGFDVETVNQWWYALQEDGDVDLQDNDNYTRKEAFFAPTQSLLQRWLREVHTINVESNRLPNVDKYRCIFIPMDLPKPNTCKTINEAYVSRKQYLSKKSHKTYEQALEEGLQEALKLIKYEKDT